MTYSKARGKRKTFKTRLPLWLYAWLSQHAYGRDCSMNQAIVDILAKHARNCGAKVTPTIDKHPTVQ